MPVFEKCDPEVAEIVNEVAEKFHQPLQEHQVTIDLIQCRATTDEHGEVTGAPLKLHGYPCDAVVRIIPYKLRVQGHGDAEITINGDTWPLKSDEEKRALIDHELTHIECKFDKDGLLRRDDMERPKLAMRLHDRQFGWFDEVARRHGPASLEVQQFKYMIEHHRQMYFDFEGNGYSEALTVGEENGTIGDVKVSVSGNNKELTDAVRDEFKKAGILAGGKKKRKTAKAK